MPEDSKGSFIRWQTIAATQLGFVVNLLLTFAVAALGLWVSLFRDSCFQPHRWSKFLFTAFALANAASVLTGLWCSLNRLHDFRLTEGIARDRESGFTNDQLSSRRSKARRLGKLTWVLFYFQIGFFTLAILSLVAMLFTTYWSKLL